MKLTAMSSSSAEIPTYFLFYNRSFSFGGQAIYDINPLRPNSDLSQTFHCNIKGFSVSEVMTIENMITQVKIH